MRGLDGRDDVKRLKVDTLQGDAGGPVLDQSGAVAGMLLPSRQGTRALPDGVQFAAKASALAGFLAQNGVTPGASDTGAPINPVDLETRATDMTVLVGCW